MTKKPYTVIGVYLDNHKRYADTFIALSPSHAEKQAMDAAESSLLIAGVVERSVNMAEETPADLVVDVLYETIRRIEDAGKDCPSDLIDMLPRLKTAVGELEKT